MPLLILKISFPLRSRAMFLHGTQPSTSATRGCSQAETAVAATYAEITDAAKGTPVLIECIHELEHAYIFFLRTFLFVSKR